LLDGYVTVESGVKQTACLLPQPPQAQARQRRAIRRCGSDPFTGGAGGVKVREKCYSRSLA